MMGIERITVQNQEIIEIIIREITSTRKINKVREAEDVTEMIIERKVVVTEMKKGVKDEKIENQVLS